MRKLWIGIAALTILLKSCNLSGSEPIAEELAETGPRPTISSRNNETRVHVVERWLYLIDVNLDDEAIDLIDESTYDMVVIDFIPSEENNTDFPIGDVVAQWHAGDHPKLVIAYIDVGEAEDYRTYWQTGWGIGNPEWIAGGDPDGWEGNFPVAYWYDEWREIWLGTGGIMEGILHAGFDGIYLDWVEAYSFDGGADNDPQGDCPLPSTEDEIDTDAYRESLSSECQRQFDDFPESTLHVSSEWYIEDLLYAKERGLTIFTVDYALQAQNIQWVYETSRALGFIPFVSNRALDQFLQPYP
jgi:cysteinyl-tRNA synthetase